MIHEYIPRVADLGSFEGTPQQLAQLVYDQIVTYPSTHDQRDWVSDCGTAACVAGWTLLFAEGLSGFSGISPAARRAASALGLGFYDATRLFYHVTEEQAVLALKFLANGEPIDWAAVGHRHPNDEVLAWTMQCSMMAPRYASS